MIRVKVRVYGRVQGVGYRYFTRRHAKALGLKGYVRNMPDGSVEVVAEGPRDKVEMLIEHLKEGPWLAEVRDVKVEYEEPKGDYDDFYIKW